MTILKRYSHFIRGKLPIPVANDYIEPTNAIWFWKADDEPLGQTGPTDPFVQVNWPTSFVGPEDSNIVATPIRPGATRIGFEVSDSELQVTAAQNLDGSIAVVIFNPTNNAKHIEITQGELSEKISISQQAIQTVLIANNYTAR